MDLFVTFTYILMLIFGYLVLELPIIIVVQWYDNHLGD